METKTRQSVLFILIFNKDGKDDEAFHLTKNYKKLSFKKNHKGNVLITGEKDKCLQFLDECSKELFYNLTKFGVYRDFLS